MAGSQPAGERRVGLRGVRRSRRGGLAGAVLAGSVTGHAIVLLWVGSHYDFSPERAPPASREPAGEISYFDLPPLAPTAATAVPAAGVRRPGVPPARMAAPSPQPLAADAPPVPSPASDARDGAAISAASAATAASLLRPGFTDPRLFAESGGAAPEAPGTLRNRFEASLGMAARLAEDSLAEERRRERSSNQVRVLGRRITVFGDSANAYWRGFVVGNQRMTLPVDGREWEDLQMKKQRDDFVRDSILRARAAATRARLDAERRRARGDR